MTNMAENIQRQIDNNYPNEKDRQEKISNTFKEIVAHHVDTKQYINNFNDQFGFIYLWEFAAATINIALSLNVSLEMSSVYLIFFAALVQLYLYCYFGNILLVQSGQ
jgi:hypothetical protein